MPNIKSAVKRMRTSDERRTRNRAAKSEILTVRRKLYEGIGAGQKEDSQKLFSQYCSVLDKGVKAGTVKANNASRRKSRAALKIAALA